MNRLETAEFHCFWGMGEYKMVHCKRNGYITEEKGTTWINVNPKYGKEL
jgi:hypothetical protein